MCLVWERVLKESKRRELVPGNFESEELSALFDELAIIRELLKFAALNGELLQGVAVVVEALLQDHYCTCCRHGLTFYFGCLFVGGRIRRVPASFSELFRVEAHSVFRLFLETPRILKGVPLLCSYGTGDTQ